jgi:gamma-glutamyltranspeptidase/glutathione hydrolase
MLARMLDHRFDIQQAIDLPSFHSEHWISSFWPRGAKPGKLVLEGPLRAGRAGRLPSAGTRGGDGRRVVGRPLDRARGGADGQIFAGANPRGMQGYAVGR